MTHPRPGGVTLICFLSVLNALVDLVLAQRNLGDMETARWVEAHPRQAQLEQFYHYLDAGLTLLASYFMLQAHAWARWLYLGWNVTRFGAATAVMLMPAIQEDFGFLQMNASTIRSGVIFVLALWLLWRADAREYFSNSRRPWWRE